MTQTTSTEETQQKPSVEFRSKPTQKQAAAPQEPKTDQSGHTSVQETSLLATYEQEVGHPYVADYFEISGVWDRFNHGEAKNINNYLIEQVQKNKLDNSTQAAKKYLKSLEKKADVSPYDTTNNRIDKIAAYIDFLRVIND